MAKVLVPKSDLLFIANSKCRVGDERQMNHLKDQKGKEIGDQETPKLFRGVGMHVCNNRDIIAEKLDAIEDSILEGDWIHFDTVWFQLGKLKPSQKVLNDFVKNQMKNSFLRRSPIYQIEEMRRKFSSLGIPEEVIDKGYEEALAYKEAGGRRR